MPKSTQVKQSRKNHSKSLLADTFASAPLLLHPLTPPSPAVLLLRYRRPNRIGRTDSGRRLRRNRRRRVPAPVPSLPSASGRHSLCPPPLMKRGLRHRERKWKHFRWRLPPECFAHPRETLRNLKGVKIIN